MLILSRRKQEKLILTDTCTNTQITVMICDVDYGKVRVGIDAPEHIKVMRSELLLENDHENKGNR